MTLIDVIIAVNRALKMLTKLFDQLIQQAKEQQKQN